MSATIQRPIPEDTLVRVDDLLPRTLPDTRHLAGSPARLRLFGELA